MCTSGGPSGSLPKPRPKQPVEELRFPQKMTLKLRYHRLNELCTEGQLVLVAWLHKLSSMT